jgi:hypothetical protein
VLIQAGARFPCLGIRDFAMNAARIAERDYFRRVGEWAKKSAPSIWVFV